VVREDALVPLPAGFEDRVAVLIEPLATPLSALRVEQLPPGSRVAVIGCGPIGLLGVYAASRAGHEVIAVEPLAARRALAERFGADRVIEDAGAIAGLGADLVLDAVGVPATVTAGTRAVRTGGTVVVLGLAAEDGVLPIADLVRRGVAIRGHYAYTRKDFAQATSLLASDPVEVDWLTVVGLVDAADGIRRLIEQPDRVTKVLVQIDGA
jgi:threonine dehydrogenase-like Zn-dependent dehydrogenase